MNLTESFSAVKHSGKDLEYPKFPVRFAKLEPDRMREPPLLGEHTKEVLRDVLEYSDARIERLKAENVI